jgi:hypothetical protein
MRISVTDPIEHAWSRMIDILFKRFELSMWFGLGLGFFLAGLGRSGGGATLPFHYTGGRPGGTAWDDIRPIVRWIGDQPYQAAGLAVAVFAVMTLIWVGLIWLRSRGVFMMIDNLAYGRGDVKAPWQEQRRHARSFFGFNLVAGLIASVVCTGTLAAGLYIMWPDLVNEVFGAELVKGLILVVVLIPLTLVNYGILEMLLVDFIAPTMYLHDLRATDAWRRWYREVFLGHIWPLTLFYLMKMLLGMAVGTVTFLAACLTCCLALTPYLGTVILLPAFVFLRCYTLYFLEQFGEPWRLFVYAAGEVRCVSCGYDLRGNPKAEACPECGHPIDPAVDVQPAR